MSKFKVGDMVSRTNYECHGVVCGYIGTSPVVRLDEKAVKSRYGAPVIFKGEKFVGLIIYDSDWELEKKSVSHHSIHITCTDGKTTHAVKKVDGKIVARSKAVCCSTDEFNANIGAELAFNRLVYGTDYHPSEVAFKCKPKQKPEYFSGKVVCVDTGDANAWWTKGKVYEYKNGFTTADNRQTSPFGSDAIKDIAELENYGAVKFIEFKGE